MKTISAIKTSRRRGFTYIEMMISVGLISIVFAFLAALALMQARDVDYFQKVSKSERATHEATEYMRYKMLKGRFGSLDIRDNGKTVRFNDPMLNSSLSQFRFLSTTLYYDDNIDESPEYIKKFDDIADATFTSDVNGNVVTATVTSMAPVHGQTSKIVKKDLSIWLRN